MWEIDEQEATDNLEYINEGKHILGHITGNSCHSGFIFDAILCSHTFHQV